MRFVLPITCVMTFCIVTVMVVDAVIPLGIMFVMFLKDDTTPIVVRLLLLVPFLVVLLPSLIKHTMTRSILTSVGAFSLIGLWVFTMVFLVVYPMPDTRVSLVSYSLPVITSIPFILAVSAAMTHNIRNIFSRSRKSVA